VLAQLVEATVDFFERPIWCGKSEEKVYEGSWNPLDKSLNGRMELLGYGVTRIRDLATNRNQDVRAAFGKAQRREAIRLGRFTVNTSSAANGVFITLTSTF
jgi:hypothetical protein